LDILHRDDLTLGGFAGLREHRLVSDSRLFGQHRAPGASDGIGNFVYLADARFMPRGETRMHPHREIDVISVMVEGRIAHEGSLEHGQEMRAGDVQVQRAGGDGFAHNEVNPDDVENRMIQMWVLPETEGEPASYKLHSLEPGSMQRIYGGPKDQTETHDSSTLIDVGVLDAGQEISVSGPFQTYLTRGAGTVGDVAVKEGDLVRGEDLSFTATENTQLIVVHLA
jgi:redox-sensitive bicupin YhaK (pirin superfamily)